MLDYLLSSKGRPGGRPGELIDPEPDNRVGSLAVYRMDFGGESQALERCDGSVDQALVAPDQSGHRLTWLHFEGDVSAAQLGRLGEVFTLHPLAMEDVLNTGQRPKIDAYRKTVFATLALPHMEEEELVFQQVSVFMGEGFVLSFHAGTHDVFEAVRERVHAAQGRIARAESDYLGYCLADIVVDTSFNVLAGYNDHLEDLEDKIFEDKTDDLIGTIHDMRRRLIGMRKVLLSQSELFTRWTTLEHALIHEDNRFYFRDVQDHARRVCDLADGYYDAAGSLLDTHLSLASARLNDVMRVLTLIATIFMPLSFIVGMYGMNFDTKYPWNMPELSFRYGYVCVVGVMLVLVAGMLVYFRRKRWL